MPYTHTCQLCGATYTNRKPESVYCSRACHAKAKRLAPKKVYPTYTCQHCGKQFTDFHPDRIYCSRKCRVAASRKQIEKTCETCGKTFQVAPNRDDTARFCSVSCAGEAKRNKVTLICKQCGAEYQQSPQRADRSNYCSAKCQAKGARKRVALKCRHCGKTYYRTPSVSSIKKGFCSRACFYAARQDRVQLVCDTCGKTYEAWPSQVRKGSRFCSKRCLRVNQGETFPARMVREALAAISIPFVQEYRVGRYWIDFYLPTYRIAIEVDGAFWHQDTERDARRDANLLRRGIVTVRISEAEARSDNVIGVLSIKLADYLKHEICPALPI